MIGGGNEIDDGKTITGPWESFNVLLGTAPPTSHPFATLRFSVFTSSRFPTDQPAGREGHQIFTCLGWKWLEPLCKKEQGEKG